MKTISASIGALVAGLALPLVSAVSIAEINGDKFLSSYDGKAVTDVTGLITAKGPSGIFLRSTKPDWDIRTSESIYVFNNNFGKNLTVGDIITISGTVSEYRSADAYLYLTEIVDPKLTKLVSSGNTVTPKVIGKDTLLPPFQQYTSLDELDVFGVPNNKSLISAKNPSLQPILFGLDFWESLSGELVTVSKPKVVNKPSSRGDTWIVGNWLKTGENKRGGLTLRDRDANPEAILIGSPLDGSKNPLGAKLGDDVEEIVGVVTQAFGFYRILPLTALKVTGSASPALPPPTSLESSGNCKGLTVGSYNVENLAATSSHIPKIAAHIVNYMKSPDIIFLQEIQDDNGVTNDAIVSANLTLTRLAEAVKAAGGAEYAFTNIDPVDDQDGGAPGGNIRTGYFYKPNLLRLRKPNPGSSTDANVVLPGPELKYNPGRIDPLNVAAWSASRKPLVAHWESLDGRNNFFTVNVHFASKGGSSSIHGDARPPVNGVVDVRILQAEATGKFIASILKEDPLASVISAGDFNEFSFVKPLETFKSTSKLWDLDAAAFVPESERYTYLFDMNAQELDHMFISPRLALGSKFEHIHINTWVSFNDQVSDHDPSVAKFNVCR